MKKLTSLKRIIANKVINRIVKIEDVGRILDLYDLKLYDLARYENCSCEDFNLFADIEFQIFSEYLKEKSCCIHHYARTSSFFILNNDSNIDEYALMRGSSLTYTEKIELLVNAFLYEYIAYDLCIEELTLTIKGDTIEYNFELPGVEEDEDIVDEYLSFFDTVEKDIIEFIKYNIINVDKVIKYIEDFKKNQIAYFNEFIEEVQ